jgi:hypothetical protein
VGPAHSAAPLTPPRSVVRQTARMRRIICLTVLALLLASPGVGHAATSYCSPETGDFCTGAVNTKGVRTIFVRTFAHRGLVKVCITHEKARDCRRFRLTPDAQAPSVYQFERRWTREFPRRGPGRYYVRFTLGDGLRLGPTLSFRTGGS